MSFQAVKSSKSGKIIVGIAVEIYCSPHNVLENTCFTQFPLVEFKVFLKNISAETPIAAWILSRKLIFVHNSKHLCKHLDKSYFKTERAFQGNNEDGA